MSRYRKTALLFSIQSQDIPKNNHQTNSLRSFCAIKKKEIKSQSQQPMVVNQSTGIEKERRVWSLSHDNSISLTFTCVVVVSLTEGGGNAHKSGENTENV